MQTWSPKANKQSLAPSSMEMLRMIDEISDAFFQLPISMHCTLFPDLAVGLNRILQYYVSKAKSCHGMSEHENSFLIQLLFQYLPWWIHLILVNRDPEYCYSATTSFN